MSLNRFYILLLFFLLVAINSSAQTNKAIGTIAFSSQPIAAGSSSQVEFLKSYELTNKSNLFITVSLPKTLTNYLHDLAPGLSNDSLARLGNYQFTFYVDSKLIYQTNLLPGAPTAAQQQTQTSWSKPLIDNQHEGAWWSQSAWNRFMYNGGDSALTDGQHALKVELRPYVKERELKVGHLIAVGEIEMKVKRKPVVNLNLVHLAPIKAYNGLPASKEHFNRNIIKTLKANVEADAFKHITSIVVLKNGKILIEEYFNGATRDSLHDVRSVGKSFASTLTGIAMQDGYLKSEQQTLGEFFDVKSYKNYSSAKENVSLKALLTMSSDFDGDDDDMTSPGNEENMYPTDDWVKFALNLPLNTNKYHGQWHYFTTGVMLLGNVLHKVVPGGLEKYADEKLFKPLGIRHYQWQYTPQQVVSTAGGIRMNSLDFAKYGQLYKNGGKWNNRWILQPDWIIKTFTKHKEITGRSGEHYGYLFWNKTYYSKGKNYEAYYCSGNGGNKIFIFKDQPLVVVITSTAYGSGYAHRQADQIIEKYILPAVL